MAMYQPFYGLTRNPFDKNQCTEKDCFESRDIRQVVPRLGYLKDTLGLGLFTARPGLGKNYALRCFLDTVNPNLFRIECISLSTVSVADFYKEVCQCLGLSDKGGKIAMFKAIQDHVWYMYNDKKQPLFLAIDEAQYLSTSVLTDIKILMNQKFDSVNCFALALFGEPYLRDTLNRPVHEALNQRVVVRYNFKGLSEQEVGDYIRHKLARANGAESIISPAAISAIASNAHGSPRLLDNFMRDALTIGAQQQKQVIDEEIAMAAISNQDPFHDD